MSSKKMMPEELPMWGDKKNTVEEVRGFLDRLGSPDRGLPVLHIAGTNGKGSVSAYLTSAFRAAGFHTGTFVSPHLVNIRERILLDGEPVSSLQFRRTAEQVEREGRAWVQEGKNFPAYFEFLYYMAMLIFAEEKVDVVILETGLGGRLDATNSCRPALSIITSISLDHTQYLGDTVEQIAGEKAGIIKAGVPLIFDEHDSRTASVLLKRAKELSCRAVAVQENKKSFLFLPAAYMRKNALVAEAAFQEAGALPVWSGVQKEALRRVDFQAAVRGTRWAGRMDEIRKDIILDGGHNEGGVKAMTEAALALCRQRRKRPVLLTSGVADKDLQSIAHILGGRLKPERLYLAPLQSERAVDMERLSACYREAGIREILIFPSVAEAFRRAAAEKEEEEILFVSGSLYLVGEVIGEVKQHEL